MIGNDGGGCKEMVRSSGGRSFQRRGAVMDMARLENMRREVSEDRERVRQEDDRVERVCWMVKSSRRYAGWEDWRGRRSMNNYEQTVLVSRPTNHFKARVW